MEKAEAIRIVGRARVERAVTWAALADAVQAPQVWTVAALLGKHPMPRAQADTVCEMLGLDADVASALTEQPYRLADSALASDPTIYRLHEAINVYGAALKELIHEEFGDGIMSAINFNMSLARREHPGGDRVRIVLDGKFLPYQWE